MKLNFKECEVKPRGQIFLSKVYYSFKEIVYYYFSLQKLPSPKLIIAYKMGMKGSTTDVINIPKLKDVFSLDFLFFFLHYQSVLACCLHFPLEPSTY